MNEWLWSFLCFDILWNQIIPQLLNSSIQILFNFIIIPKDSELMSPDDIKKAENIVNDINNWLSNKQRSELIDRIEQAKKDFSRNTMKRELENKRDKN